SCLLSHRVRSATLQENSPSATCILQLPPPPKPGRGMAASCEPALAEDQLPLLCGTSLGLPTMKLSKKGRKNNNNNHNNNHSHNKTTTTTAAATAAKMTSMMMMSSAKQKSSPLPSPSQCVGGDCGGCCGCSCGWLLSSFKLVGLVACYYFLSISLTFYNKVFVKHFRLPLSLTLFHLLIKFLLSWIIRVVWEWRTGVRRVEIHWSAYIKRLAPPGIVSALDIGLSNWSFEYITVSLYTMSKSSTVLFILAFSLLFRLEKFRPSLLVVVIFISGGLFLFTYHSTEFNLIGFILVMTATFLSGLRWTLTQLVTQKDGLGLRNPLDMMYHIEPWMIIGLLPLSAAFEGVHIVTTNNFFRSEHVLTVLQNGGLALIGAVLAFFMELAEFLLITNTSSLTFSISGIFKEIIVLFLAAEINGDHISSLNAAGFIICLCGMSFHILLKNIHRKKDEGHHKIEDEETVEMLNTFGEANSDDDEDTWMTSHPM
ncbi:solute carrier family 35 member C2-like, partial [Argonauta hians]